MRSSRDGLDGRGVDGALRDLAESQVVQIQRARILAGMYYVVAERGAAGVSVADVVARSGVSRRTFYEVFSDREDCFLAAFDDALALAAARVLPAYRGERKWRERIRAGLVALLRFLDEEPVMARLLVAESLSLGARALERRRVALSQLIEAVDAGREESKMDPQLLPLTGEGTVGGALSIVQRRLIGSPHDEALVKLTNQLMGMIVMPYLGPAAARRELDRPFELPTGEQPRKHLSADPFKDAGMRLTYRTVRVLLAVAEHPNASNRKIGELAEIHDQGQISKLLGRLKRIGLIDNGGVAPGQGAPNAWVLSAKGRQVVNSIRAHTGYDCNPPGEGVS
jgi:AcrR family transcriptional regulator